MVVNGRNKGANFERDVAKILNEELGLTFKRDLDQYREKDRGDLICTDPTWPFLIECKRISKTFQCKPAWFAQAKAAADLKLYPVVIWKADNLPVRVTMEYRHLIECHTAKRWSADNDHLVTMSMEAFLYLVRETLAQCVRRVP